MKADDLVASMKQAMDRLEPLNKHPYPGIFGPMSFAGIKINVVDKFPLPQPKLKIRDNFEWVSEGFRGEMNAWLCDRFGTEGHKILMTRDGNLMFMNPETAVLLRNIP